MISGISGIFSELLPFKMIKILSTWAVSFVKEGMIFGIQNSEMTACHIPHCLSILQQVASTSELYECR